MEGITDLSAFNNLCFLPFSLLSPVTQKCQGHTALAALLPQEASWSPDFIGVPVQRQKQQEMLALPCGPRNLLIPSNKDFQQL